MKTRILIFISLLAAIMLRNVIGQESPGGGVRPANQAEVNAGTVSNKYVSPKTLSGWSGGSGGGTGVTDGSKGDVDVSGSGTTWTVTGHAGSMTGVGPYTNLYGVFIGTGGVLQMESLPDLSQLSPYDMITTVDPFNFKWNSKTILALSTNTSTISSNLTVAGTNSMRVAKITGIATNSILRTAANGDIVPTTIGSGLTLSAGGTLDVAGGGGGGGAPAMSYVALPASGIVGGTQLAYSTNLSADISVTFSNLLGTNRYFLQWLSTGQKVTFNNSGALYFLDAGQGGYSESSTNAGVYEMQVWKDDVSGRTNVMYSQREFVIDLGPGIAAETNYLTGRVTLSATNHWTQLPTNRPPTFRELVSVVMNDPQWQRAIDEEWNVGAASNGRWGREDWSQLTSGTVNVGTGFDSQEWGSLALNCRTAGSRHALFMHSGLNVLMTNAQAFWWDKVKISALDSGGDTNTLRHGLTDSGSAEPANGTYWRTTNNVIELVTARSSSRTVTTTSNLVANVWLHRAWFLDRTGTNVYGYIGTGLDNMAIVATNSANIPHDQKTQPFIYAQTGLTNSTAGITNFVAFTRLWVRPN